MPLRRIDLTKARCVRLDLIVHAKLAAVEDDFGRYGARYSRSRHRHIVQGSIRDTNETALYHVDLGYRVADWGPPPEGYRNPDRLWDLLCAVSGDLDFHVTATFHYPLAEWQPLLEIPMELPTKLPSFSHIEAVTLTKRIGATSEYSVTIAADDKNNVVHIVQADKKTPISESAVRGLLDYCKSLSFTLLRKVSVTP